METFKSIAFTHKNASLEEVGKLHIADDVQQQKLAELKEKLELSELMYLSTCNRVEFYFISETDLSHSFLVDFFSTFFEGSSTNIQLYAEKSELFEGNTAVEHIFKVASSLDSMVVGEREIITQVRKAYDTCFEQGLTGDIIRLITKFTIQAAKRVYTETNISKHPVSVVSLAYRELLKLNVKLEAKILVVGAGQTNKNLTNFLFKHGYKNYTVFNRTLNNALGLAKALHAEALPLSELANYSKGFDVIITCTASEEYIITPSLYNALLMGDKSTKTIIDLAIPTDVDPSIKQDYSLNLIQVDSLKEQAEENIKIRKKELIKCNAIINSQLEDFNEAYHIRKVERAMSSVPKKVKEIKQRALEEVFAKELTELDDNSKEIVDKIMAYVEKKYISVPMKMAKEILLEQPSK